jgi:nitrite reductase/ring-hydroxylating ferredoxin subunit
MKVYKTFLFIILLIIVPFDKSISQETKTTNTEYVYILESMEDISKMEMDAEVTFSKVATYVITKGDNAFHTYNKVCLHKGDLETEEEGRLTRATIECISGGKLIVTSRPGQEKFAFVNKMEGAPNSFSSGIIFTNFSADSTSELLFW